MKCPKCGYVGFEETDRCRHCGYEFALASSTADFAPSTPMDVPMPRPFAPIIHAEPEVEHDDYGLTTLAAPAGDAPPDLPLRAPSFPMLVHDSQPPPARTPLAVRRASADRPRSRATTVVRRPSSPLLETAPDPERQGDGDAPAAEAAPAGRRLAAALVDFMVVAGIDLAVVYLTVQLAGLRLAEAGTLPLVPLGAFLLGLNVAYLAVFTASGGQTLGKMAMGLRVEAVSGGLSAGGAVVRVGVALVGAVLAGAGFLPALVRADGRAVHDYAARTRVVRVPS